MFFQMTYKCSECQKNFTRKFNRDKHFKNKHLTKEDVVYKKKFTCPFCQQNNIDKHLKKRNFWCSTLI